MQRVKRKGEETSKSKPVGKDKQAELHILTSHGTVALIGWEIVPKEFIQNKKQQKRQSQKKKSTTLILFYSTSFVLLKIRNVNYIADTETLNM